MKSFVTLVLTFITITFCNGQNLSDKFSTILLNYYQGKIGETYWFDTDNLVTEKVNQWSLNIESKSVNYGGIDYTVNIKLKKGRVGAYAGAVQFTFDKWLKSNYVFCPGVVYDGNNFNAIENNKPVLPNDIHKFVGNPPVMDVYMSDTYTPAFGFYDKQNNKGFLLLTVDDSTYGGNKFTFTDNPSLKKSFLRITAPRNNGMQLQQGDVVKIRFRVYSFPCNSMDDFMEKFFVVRHEMDKQRTYVPSLITGNSALYMDKSDRNSFADGFEKWMDNLVAKQDASGLYTTSPNDNLISVRYNGFALAHAIQIMDLFKTRGEESRIKDSWKTSVKKCADEIVKIMSSAENPGQYVSKGDAAIIVPNSTAGALSVVGMVYASKFFNDLQYLDAARKMANAFAVLMNSGYIGGSTPSFKQFPDLQNGIDMCESFVALYEMTHDNTWLDYAKTSVAYMSSLIKRGQCKFDMLTGDCLFKLFRYTGDERYFDLSREVVNNDDVVYGIKANSINGGALPGVYVRSDLSKAYTYADVKTSFSKIKGVNSLALRNNSDVDKTVTVCFDNNLEYGGTDVGLNTSSSWKIINVPAKGSSIIKLTSHTDNTINLKGEWQYILNPEGLDDAQCLLRKPDGKIELPGSVQSLQKDNSYKGVVYYTRNIDIPLDWHGHSACLYLERPNAATTLFVDGVRMDSRSDLFTSHKYLIKNLTAGDHIICVKVDNSQQGDIAVWNGITGAMDISVASDYLINNIKISPNIAEKKAVMTTEVENLNPFDITVSYAYLLKKDESSDSDERVLKQIVLKPGVNILTETLLLQDKLWSEFTPWVYNVQANLSLNGIVTTKNVSFGLCEASLREWNYAINNVPVYFRGVADYCEFPNTIYPSTDRSFWIKRFAILKNNGFNNVCFYSWCPPDVAMSVADSLGLYLQVSLPDNTNMDLIKREYGNHPSLFVLNHDRELLKINPLIVRNGGIHPIDVKGLGKSYATAQIDRNLLLYKEDIEGLLSMTETGGFCFNNISLTNQLENKQFSAFCGPAVPLISFAKCEWQNTETMEVKFSVNYYGQKDVDNVNMHWEMKDEAGKIFAQGVKISNQKVGNYSDLGSVKIPLSEIKTAGRYVITATFDNIEGSNSKSVWVYPSYDADDLGDIYYTTQIDSLAIDTLKKGAKVWFDIPLNTLNYTDSVAIVDRGIYCESTHPVFDLFPSSTFCDEHWRNICDISRPMDLSKFPSSLTPILNVIDVVAGEGKRAFMFEALVGKGKIFVTSIDFNNPKAGLSAKSLKHSMLDYLKGDKFNPSKSVSIDMIQNLQKKN